MKMQRSDTIKMYFLRKKIGKKKDIQQSRKKYEERQVKTT